MWQLTINTVWCLDKIKLTDAIIFEMIFMLLQVTYDEIYVPPSLIKGFLSTPFPTMGSEEDWKSSKMNFGILTVHVRENVDKHHL